MERPFAPANLFAALIVLTTALAAYRLASTPVELNKGQTDNYWPIANNVLDGKGYALCYPLYFPFCTEPRPTAMREPVPVLLFAAASAITGRSLKATLLLEGVAYLATLVLLWRWVRRHHGERVALIACLGWATSLPVLQTIPQLSGDLIGATVFMGAVTAFDRARRNGTWPRWALAGALLGLAALCRSVLLFTVLPWAWYAWRSATGGSRTTRTRIAAALVGALAVVLAPWVIRNALVFGRFWPGTSMNGYNLFRNSYQVFDHQPPHYVGASEAQVMLDNLLHRHPELRGDEGEAEMDRVYMAEGKLAVQENPLGFAKLVLYRFVPLWTNHGVPEQYGRVVTRFDRAMLVQQVVVLLLLVLGAFLHRAWAGPWLVTIAVQVVLYMLVVAQVRYLLPVLPLVMTLAALGIDWFLPRRALPGRS